MSKVTIREWYERVNSTWPAGLVPTVPTEYEARRGARALWRAILGGRAPEVEITSGNRYTWTHKGKLRVNPNRREYAGRDAQGNERWIGGWQAIVHDLSHLFHRRLNPGARPHGAQQARLEIRCIKIVVKRGWFTGSLLPVVLDVDADTIKANLKAKRLAQVEAGIKRWTTKAKRAATALKKLERERRRLTK